MKRLCLGLCVAATTIFFGMASSAEAQYYSAYYHAPPYASYAGYTPYGFNGPFRLLDWRWWAGTPPYTPAMTYPAYGNYGSSYVAGYQPVTYTASYAPSVYTAGYFSEADYWPSSSTTYYTPSYGIPVTSYYSPSMGVSAASLCCNPCSRGVGYGTPACPGGDCGMNYQPSPADGPVPDGNFDGASGARKFENQSESRPGANDPFEPYNRGTDNQPPDDGFGSGTDRGAGYSPPSIIEKAPPAKPEPSNESGSDSGKSDGTGNSDAASGNSGSGTGSGNGSGTGSGNGSPEAGLFRAPIPEPETLMPLVNRDSRISAAPSLLEEGRRRMSARFSSPELTRAEVDPEELPRAEDLQLVSK